MKIKFISLLCFVFLCFSLVGCGDSEPKRPIDYPESEWGCNVANISFSVSQESKIVDAKMVDKNGEVIDISLVFSDIDEGKVSITNADETETYLSGTCSYAKDKCTVTVTDIYNADLEVSSTRLVFERK